MSMVPVPIEVETLPAQLRELRSQRSITQKQLAERARVSQQTISAIEQGRMDPSFKLLKSIAVVLGVALLIGAGVAALSEAHAQATASQE